MSDEWSDRARDRWLASFGPLQQRLEVAGHNLVLVDAPGLVEEESRRQVSGMSFARWAAAHPEGPIAFAQQSAQVTRKFYSFSLQKDDRGFVLRLEWVSDGTLDAYSAVSF